MSNQTKVGLTHAGSALGGAIAALSFAATHKVDLYALMDQINVVVADISRMIALLTPLATGAYAVYKASTKQQLLEVVNDPKAPQVARDMPNTPQSDTLADAMKLNGNGKH